MPAAERTAASTGSGEATSTTEGAQDGNIKQWVGQQLEPIRTAQRDIVKSLNELLDMHGNNKDTNGQLMAKLDKLQVTVDRTLDLHKTDASVQIGEKVGKFQAAVDQSIELHKTAAKTADKLAKDLHELTEISGRRHAATEVATEGTQEQLRGLKRELEATYTSLRDHRSQLKEHVTESGKRRMDILQEISQMSTKLHNGFAGLSALTRTHSSAITETKETTERTLEVAEKTLAAVRVSGPSPSETELLEAVGDTQKSLNDIKMAMDTLEGHLESLKSMVSAPTPPPPHAPVHVPAASSHSVPPPPQHSRQQWTLRKLGKQWAHGCSDAREPASNSSHDGQPCWGRIQLTVVSLYRRYLSIFAVVPSHNGSEILRVGWRVIVLLMPLASDILHCLLAPLYISDTVCTAFLLFLTTALPLT